jgi:hypothetical protein
VGLEAVCRCGVENEACIGVGHSGGASRGGEQHLRGEFGGTMNHDGSEATITMLRVGGGQSAIDWYFRVLCD